MKSLIESHIEFTNALPVLEDLHREGFEAYFVGGSVRDALLHQPVNDVDIATSANPQEIKKIFPHTIDVGIEHGTVLVVIDEKNQYEITTFRTESTYQDFRRPDEVSFVRSLEEDLKRRDFTMNALALDKNGQLIDYYNGFRDLKSKVIRAVGKPVERFHEDALRMMRAVRFASQLDFTIEPETLRAISENAHLLSHIATERIAIEFEKMMMGVSFQQGLTHFLETGLFHYCPGFQGAKNALKHLLEIDVAIDRVIEGWTLVLWALQQETILDVKETSARQFLKKWKLSNEKINQIIEINQRLHQRISGHEIDPKYIFELGIDQALTVEEILNRLGYSNDKASVHQVAKDLPITQKADLDISGHDLMTYFDRRQGPWIGHLMEQALEAVIMGEINNERIQILHYLRENC